jgi:hypothetical protein
VISPSEVQELKNMFNQQPDITGLPLTSPKFSPTGQPPSYTPLELGGSSGVSGMNPTKG